MLEPKLDNPLSEIQSVTILNLAEKFKAFDRTGESHEKIADSILKIVSNAKDPAVRRKGLALLGNYADDFGYDYGIPQVQDKIIDKIASIAAQDPDAAVKDNVLSTIIYRFDQPDSSGERHGQAVEAIKKIAASVTVSEDSSPEKTLIVKKAIDKLASYVKGLTTGREYFPEAQSKAKEAVDYLIATVGVEKFEHLKP